MGEKGEGVRAKPKGVRRFTREQLLQEMRRFIRKSTLRDTGITAIGPPITVGSSRYPCCLRTVKQGHKRGCPVRELLWNIEFDLWLSKPM